jgi:hypothetical protein
MVHVWVTWAADGSISPVIQVLAKESGLCYMQTLFIGLHLFYTTYRYSEPQRRRKLGLSRSQFWEKLCWNGALAFKSLPKFWLSYRGFFMGLNFIPLAFVRWDLRKQWTLDTVYEVVKTGKDTTVLSLFILVRHTYLFTYGAEPFLRSCQLCSHSQNSQQF